MSIIKTKRNEMGLSRNQLSTLLEVHPQVIVRWEMKTQVPSLLDVPKIKKVMKISFKELLNDYKEEK